MGHPNDFHLYIYEGEDITFKGYVTDDDGTAITLIDLKTSAENGDEGMDVFVYDEDVSPSVLVYTETDIDLSVAGADAHWYPTILDSTTTPTGPTTTGWSKSPPGANLAWTLTNVELETGGAQGSGTTTMVGGHRLRIEIHLNRAASVGGDIILRGVVDVAPLSSK